MRNTRVRALQAAGEESASPHISPTCPMCPHHGHPVPKLCQPGERRSHPPRVPSLVELKPESCCVATCDSRALKLLSPMLSSSSGANRLLLLNITLTFPICSSLKIFQIFSKAKPQRMLFSSPQGAEELACFPPTKPTMILHGFIISFQAASHRDPRAASEWGLPRCHPVPGLTRLRPYGEAGELPFSLSPANILIV